MKKKKARQALKSQSSKKGKRIPPGKVILYVYVKPENKTYFEEQAKLVGGNSRAMDILLDDLRWKKKNLKATFSRGQVEE